MSTIIIITPANPPKPPKYASPAERKAYVKAHIEQFLIELNATDPPAPQYSYAIED